MRFLWALSQLFVLLVFLVSGAASAQTSDADARREAFERGQKAIVEENWAQAHRIYVGLWQEQKTYDVALSLGLVEINLQRHAEAAEHLQFGLANMPAREKPEIVERSRKLFDLARQNTGSLVLSVDRPGAEVRDGPRILGRSPIDSEIFLSPGPHWIQARLGDQTRELKVDIARGERIAAALEFGSGASSPPPEVGPSAPTGEPPPRAPESPPRDSRSTSEGSANLPAYLAGGVALVATATGIGLLLAGNSKESDKDAALTRLGRPQPCAANTPHVTECARIRDLASEAASLRTAGIVSLAVGGVAAATAITLFVWPRDTESATTPSTTVGLSLSPHFLGASARGTF